MRLILLLLAIASAAPALAQQPLPPLARESMPSLGCYKDTSVLDLDGHLERSAQNTPQRCIAICREKGFRYAAVQYGESCLCGNSYGRYGPATNCDMQCTGAALTCGGYAANEVFSTGN